MITNRTLIIVVVLLLSACSAHRFPRPAEVGRSTLGSHITITRNTSQNRVVRGELIAVELKEVLVLTTERSVKKIVAVDIKNIKRYKIKFAHPTTLDWTIPVFSLAALTHGWYALLTVPVNIILTGLAAGDGRYKYSQRALPITELKYFARFPQGVPNGIDSASLE